MAVVRCEREETEEVLPRDADSGVERSAPIHDRPWSGSAAKREARRRLCLALFDERARVADDAERGTMPGGTGGRTKRRARRRGEVGCIRRVGVGVVITQEGRSSSGIGLNGM